MVASYSFTGLTPITTSYTFTIFGSRAAGDPRSTKYTLAHGGNSKSQSLRVAGPVNNSKVVRFKPIISSREGTVTLSFVDDMRAGANQFGYLNVIRIDASDADAQPVSKPPTLLLLGLALGGGMLLQRRSPLLDA